VIFTIQMERVKRTESTKERERAELHDSKHVNGAGVNCQESATRTERVIMSESAKPTERHPIPPSFNQVKDSSCIPYSPMIQTVCMANSNAKVQLKTLSDGYSLVVDGEESEPVGYGEPLEMETTDGRRFIAFVEANGSDLEAMTEFWAYEVSPVVDVPILEDEDEDEDEGEAEEVEGEEDEDEDEEVEVEIDQAAK
jgi:hypothetical protein